MTTPQEYLRKIRDLQAQNLTLLTELVHYHRRREKRRKWKLAGKISMILMPYVLTVLLGFFFYSQITATIGSFQEALVNFFPDFPKISEVKDSFW